MWRLSCLFCHHGIEFDIVQQKCQMNVAATRWCNLFHRSQGNCATFYDARFIVRWWKFNDDLFFLGSYSIHHCSPDSNVSWVQNILFVRNLLHDGASKHIICALEERLCEAQHPGPPNGERHKFIMKSSFCTTHMRFHQANYIRWV